jgi:MoaA/NifB/PqqE/SkfB family radical SAM enzyme
VLGKLALRFATETDPRLLARFAYNMGFKGMRSIARHKKRLRKGEHFPPFLFLSIINSCQLRCQGCWVDVDAPRRMLERATVDRILNDAKRHGNSYFGLLGGEPFLHPKLFDILAGHRDCYFHILTNGHLITDEAARELRRIGNASPLISVEGNAKVSDLRRGRSDVLDKTLAGIENCRRNRLITGVATSVCQNNIADLASEDWLRTLIRMGVHCVWYYTYRTIGPSPAPELALRPEQVRSLRRFIVQMRKRLPIAIIDAYWDHQGRALCPMAMGVSHHISPYGDVEPCPIIQFACESVDDNPSLYETMNRSVFLDDFREVAARATRGCIILERPDLVRALVQKHGARDTSQRQTGLRELDSLQPACSQYDPDHAIPEEHWAYRFAKKHWFFGFGAYS